MPIIIDGFEIGSSTFIVAELSANHGGSIDIAKKTIKAAKDAGANALKIQTYTPDTITMACDNPCFILNEGTIWDGRTFHDLYQEAFTPWQWQEELMAYAKSLGLVFFSTPFDNTAVDFLEALNVPAYKVASFEILDISLIEYIASRGKPVMISTGIAGLDDIGAAVDACRRMGNEQIILLKCTSSYPARIEEANLKTIPDMKKRFGVQVGLSDHTMDNIVPVAAVAVGATVVEKHFILDRSVGGPDASFSIEPETFAQMVWDIRQVEKALGAVDYSMTEKKLKSRLHGRSLFAVADIRKGACFTADNIRSIRPGYGLAPKHLNKVLGTRALRDIKKGTPLDWILVDKTGLLI
ncbi:pseudaminic acid synthase [uncultured Desulfobacter sp.]|uniref:pseudaminic acid synthase n=1 Tax=uncultured Desulfobacter sp. TaxID=240139 RepID=UPI002AABFF31|nr:pseudaminic acid synthase [uncultured Desulfobacter sp.]